MIELHLIGYTADLGRLVLDLAGADGGRYRLVVDEDLFATLDELREERRAAGLPVGDLVEYADELGLDRDHLARVQDEDEAAAAAAGRVSSGSVAGARLLQGGADDPEAGEPARATPDANPDHGPGDAPDDDVERPYDDGPDEARDQVRDDQDAPRGGWRPTPLPARGHAPSDGPDEGARRWGDDETEGLVARLLQDRTTATAPEPPPEPDPQDAPAPDPVPEPAREPRPAPSPPPDSAPPPDPGPPPDPTPGGSTREPSPADEDPAIPVPPRPDGGRRQPPRPLAPEPARRPRPAPRPAATPEPDPTARPEAGLSPAEIQARLRHGRSVRAVAREAGVDEAWIRRWEAPIVAEQARVRDQALAARLHRPRLGRSTQPLGTAVATNLAARGVADDDIAWEVSRRRDGRWRVVVRFVSRGRKRSATWIWDPEDDAVTPASDSARDLGFTRRGR